MRSVLTRWALAVTAVAVSALLLGPAGAALAGPYPVSECSTLSVSTSVPHPGQAITVAGTGFTAGARLTLVLHSAPVTVGRATVAADGTFSAAVTIPNDVTGRHLLYVDGGDPQCPVDPAVLDIEGANPTAIVPQGDGPLAVTGTDLLTALALAALLIGAGVALNHRGRRRHRPHHSA